MCFRILRFFYFIIRNQRIICIFFLINRSFCFLFFDNAPALRVSSSAVSSVCLALYSSSLLSVSAFFFFISESFFSLFIACVNAFSALVTSAFASFTSTALSLLARSFFSNLCGRRPAVLQCRKVCINVAEFIFKTCKHSLFGSKVFITCGRCIFRMKVLQYQHHMKQTSFQAK